MQQSRLLCDILSYTDVNERSTMPYWITAEWPTKRSELRTDMSHIKSRECGKVKDFQSIAALISSLRAAFLSKDKLDEIAITGCISLDKNVSMLNCISHN